MANGWKVAAIIFIILFVAENILIGWLMSVGIDQANKESECSVNVCDSSVYDAYYYDISTEMCYCYEGENIVESKFLG